MKNEPIVLAENVAIGLSTAADGDMRAGEKTGESLSKIYENREKFFARNGFEIEQTTLVMIDYDTQDFCRYGIASKDFAGRGMTRENPIRPFDMLATKMPHLGLFLPLGDCLGAVLYDASKKILAVSHLGRHSLEQFGARKSVEFFASTFHSDPRDIKVWLSPAAGAKNYPLFAFQNRGLRDVAIEQFENAGISLANISGDDIDTTTDPNYFSHSNWRKENLLAPDARFAIVAKMLK